MVATVTGEGLGLFNLLGGAVGNAQLGQSNDSVYVNTANGNLVIQAKDEFLASLGLNDSLIRTYNSLGQLTDDNGDNWRLNVSSLQSINPGVSLVRVAGDGNESVFTYNATTGRYESSSGSGANDWIVANADGTWTYTEGSSLVSMTYGSDGKLVSATDTNGNSLSYAYNTDGFVNQITDASGQTVSIAYSGNDITSITTNSAGQAITRVRYGYDSQNRLSQVIVDLTPQDGSISDGNTYVTSYTYDGTSRRITSITSGQGDVVQFAYDTAGRIASVTDGAGNVTNYSYSGGGSVDKTGAADASALSQNLTTDYAVNSSALSNTDTTSYSLDSGQLSTTDTVNYSTNSSALSTTDSTSYSANSSTLQTTDTATYALDSTQLVTTATQTEALNSSLLSTTTQVGENLAISTSNGSVSQTGNVANYAWARSGTSLVQTTGISLVAGSAAHGDTTPTQVRADIYRSDGSLYGTVYTDVGYYTNQAWYAYTDEYGTTYSTSSVKYTYGTDEYGNTIVTSTTYGTRTTDGHQWHAVSNWNGEVNLSTGSMPGDTYTIVISTRDDAQQSGAPGKYYDYTDGTWAYTNTVTATVGVQVKPTTASWSSGTVGLGTTHATIAYRPSGSTAAYTTANVTLGGSTDSANLGNLAAGNYDYQIRYYDGNNNVVKSSDGTLSVGTGTTQSVTGSFTATVSTAPYYQVQSGDTWSSIATYLYGTSNVASQLESALGSPALTAGVDLTGLPASLSYNYSTAPYYQVQSGDTWASIATKLYGTSNVSDELQAALGSPTLTAGIDLTSIPSSLTDTFTTAPYYLVQTGDTWASIATTIYGTANVASALQSALGNPALTAGTHLTNIPSSLTYTYSVAPYYLVQSGDTWASIATAVYGTSDVASELQTALGNPSLVAGAQLTNLPASLSYTYTVSPYYLVQSGDTWASIATTLYGTSNVASALETALGSPSLTAGLHLANIPASLDYTYSVAPYYVIQSGDTWASIATKLYGTDLVSNALQSALGNPALTAGSRLTNLPASLSNTVVVAPYYLVQSGDTWASIAQTVYGDANAANSLAAKMGNPTLAAGLILTMPKTLTYTYVDQTTNRVDITDARGNVTSMIFDQSGRVMEELSQTVSGQRSSTLYSYDSNNDIISTTDGNGNTTLMTYDAAGNLLSSSDSLGNSVKYTYNAENQLLNKIQYLVPDPDALGSKTASDPIVSRNVYDSGEHLRFVVSPQGHVIEHRYNAAGELTSTIKYTRAVYDLTGLSADTSLTESELANWAAAQDQSQIQRTDYSYDFRGQLASTTSYASVDASGNGVTDGTQSTTQFVYDQYGNLLQTTDPRGAATSGIAGDYTHYVTYDGMGRVLSTTNSLGQTATNLYDDANNTITSVAANGLSTTKIYNANGQLVSQTQNDANSGASLGTTTYLYDANGNLREVTDPTGNSTYNLYDARNREIATVDKNGVLTEMVYDNDNNVVKTIAYANKLSAATLATFVDASGNPANIDLSTLRTEASNPAQDRTAYSVYNADNQLVYTIDALGYVTQNFYDGAGRKTDTVAYVSPINTANLPAEPGVADITLQTSAADRHTRYFYDNDGLLLATLNADGYLTENHYDDAGHVVETIAYATATNASMRSSGTLAELRPASSSSDINTHTLYNAEGQVVAKVDGEGYLTQTVYDLAGNVTQTIRYASRANAWFDGATLTDLIPAASSQDRVSTNTYDALNQLVQSVNYQGTVTTNSYDKAGNLVQSTTAAGTADARSLTKRYDVQGHVIAELTSQGAALIAQNPTATQAEIDSIWASHAVFHTYNVLGELTSTTDVAGNTSYFYYDNAGRLSLKVTADGAVTENHYDSFGDVVETVQYANRLDSSQLATLTGGQLNSYVTGLVSGLASANDIATTNQYDQRGALVDTIDAMGYSKTNSYTAFGQLAEQTTQINATDHTSTVNTYDRMGQLTEVIKDASGTNAIQSASYKTYDAFGHVVLSVDPNGNVTSYQYDILGRTIEVTDPLNGVTQTQYDAFGQVLRTINANGGVTSYTYNNTDRSMTVTSPGNIQTKIYKNEFGQKVEVIDGNGNITKYSYDTDGNLVSTTDALGNQTTKTYDNADRLIQTTDANGTVTQYQYDAANRVISTTMDPAGLNIVTTVAYDAFGRKVTSTDGNGVVTETQYDKLGQVTAIIVDPASSSNPSGQNLTTTFTYDGMGNKLSVTTGAGTTGAHTTQYIYDHLKRLTQQVVDPGGLALTTSYTYDKDGNKISSTNANGVVTQTEYDADNRVLRRIVDPGGLNLTTEYSYDAKGNMLSKTTAAGTADAHTTTYTYDSDNRRIKEIVDPSGLALTTKYQYDNNGNVIAKVDPNHIMTTYSYDALNRNIQTVVDPSGLALTTSKSYDANGNLISTIDANGVTTTRSYDARGLLHAKTIDPSGLNIKTVYKYDSAGNNTEIVYAAGTSDKRVVEYRYDSADRKTDKIIDPNGLSIHTHYIYDVNNNLVATKDADNNVSRSVYDAANRLIYSVDAQGTVTAQHYDGNGNVVRKTIYANQVDAASLPNDTSQSQLEAVLGSSPDDRNIRYVYDKADRNIYQVDSLGAVVQRNYDGNGNVVKQIAYANFVNLGSLTGYKNWDSEISSQLSQLADPNNDRVTREVYDSASRLRFTVNSAGAVKEKIYDNNGNVTESIAYAELIDPTLADSANPLSDVSSVLSAVADSSQDEVSKTFYDAANRAVYAVNANNYVTHNVYDKNGNMVQTVAYATQLSAGQSADISTLQSAVAGLPSTDNRTSTFAYDAANRKVFTVDALGNAVESVYNNLSQATETIKYATTISVSAGMTPNDISALLDTGNTQNRVDQYQFDAGGHLISHTDALQHTESYTYDAMGNKLSYTNQNGATWTYSYDKNGKLLQENSPVVEVSRLAVVNGNVTVEKANQSIATLYTYDAFGNVTSKTEGAGTINERTTRYEYDLMGRQIKTITPSVGVYDPSQDTGTSATTQSADVNNYAVVLSNGQLTHVTGVSLQLDPSYYVDTTPTQIKATIYRSDGSLYGTVYTDIGQTTTQQLWIKDEYGNWHLSTTEYGSVGNKVTVTGGWSGQVNLSLSSMAADTYTVQVEVSDSINSSFTGSGSYYDGDSTWVRTGTITATVGTVYGAVNRAETQTTPTSTVTYNAFGNAVVNNDVAGVNTYKVYDQEGRVVYEIDGNKYVTEYAYDAFGNQTASTRYANAISFPDNRTQPFTVSEVKSLLNAANGNTVNVDNYSSVSYVAPQQSYTYSNNVVDATSQNVASSDTLNVTNNYEAQSSNVENYAWARSGTSLVQTTGISLATGTASRADNTPTQVRADIYRSDGSLYGTVYTDVGYYTNQAWYAYTDEYGTTYSTSSVKYTYGTDEYGNTIVTSTTYGTRTTDGHQWHAVSNWNGQVNLSTGSMPSDIYKVVISTRDDAQVSGYPGTYYDYTDGKWTRSNQVTVAVGQAYQSSTLNWASAEQPANTTTEFLYRPAGSNGAFTSLPVSVSGNSQQVLLPGINGKSYEYEIHYRDSNGMLVKSATGTLAIDGSSATASQGLSFTTYTGKTTTTTGSAIENYVSSSDYTNLDYIDAKVYDTLTGAQVSDAITIPRFDSAYNGYVNLAVGKSLADGQYSVAITYHYKNGTQQNRTQFTYQVGSQAQVNRETSLSWSTQAQPANTSVVFSYAVAGSSTYTSINVSQDSQNAVDKVILQNLATGTYNYRIDYVDSNNNVVQSSTGQFSSAVGNTLAPLDRTIYKNYDQVNQLTQTIEPSTFNYDSSAAAGQQYFNAGVESRNYYNAFGDVIEQSVLVNPLTNSWNNTYNYYDQLGRKTMMVDPMGYVTKSTYDFVGNLIEQTQYAKAASGTWGQNSEPTITTTSASANDPAGYDRTTQYTYDLLNRKLTQTQVGVNYSTAQYGTVMTTSDVNGNATTSYAYDNVGNVISVTDANNTTVYRYYDAMGRTTAVAKPGIVMNDGSKPSLPGLSVVYSAGASELKWDKPADSKTVVGLRYKLTGTTNWTTANITAQGNSLVTDVSSLDVGRYDYELTYTQNGSSSPYMSGTGQFAITGNTATGSTDIAGFVQEPYVDSRVTASSQYVSTEYGGNWTGSNSVKLNWNDLSQWGNGDVRVTISYVSANSSGATSTAQRTVVLSSDNAKTGTTISWGQSSTASPLNYDSLKSVSSIKVEKQVDGQYVTLLNQASGVSKEQLFLRGATAGLSSVTINGTAYAATALGADVYSVDVSGLARGSYQYSAVSSAGTFTGNFSVTGAGGSSTPAVQEYYSNFNVNFSNNVTEYSAESTVNMKWGSLEGWGNGAVTVKVDYIDKALWSNTETAGSKTFTFNNAADVMTGASVSWGDGNLNRITRVRLYKNVDGNNVLVTDKAYALTDSNNSTDSESRLFISTLPSTVSDVTLQYRPAGSTGAYLTVNASKLGNGWFAVDYTNIPTGQYEYILNATDTNGNPIDLSGIGGATDGTYAGDFSIMRGAQTATDITASTATIETPVTEFSLDAFGKTIAETTLAAGATEVSTSGYRLIDPTSADNQTTYRYYDSHGHVIESIDPNGSATYTSYDANGHAAKQWRAVTNYDGTTINLATYHQYDNVGHESVTIKDLDGTSNVTTRMQYDAFGEMTHRSIDGYSKSEYFQYDNAGRLWRTNQNDGVNKVTLFNLAGEATSKVTSPSVDLSASAYSDPASVIELGSAIRRTDTVYDADGRSIEQLQPWTETKQYDVSPAVVTSKFDVKGYQNTTDEYGYTGSSVSLAWSPLDFLGSGNVEVTIKYQGQVNGAGATRNLEYRQTFSSASANQGVNVSWAASNQSEGSIQSISDILVYKNVDGQRVLVYESAGDKYSVGLWWKKTGLPGSVATVKYTPAGTTTWSTATAQDRGGYYFVDLTGKNADVYDYQLSLSDPNNSSTPYYQTSGQFVLGTNDSSSTSSVNVAAFADHNGISVNSVTPATMNEYSWITPNQVQVSWDSMVNWGEGAVTVLLDYQAGGSSTDRTQSFSFNSMDGDQGATLTWTANTYGQVTAVNRVRVYKVVNGVNMLVRDTATAGANNLILSGNTAGISSVMINGSQYNPSSRGGDIYSVSLAGFANGTYHYSPIGTQSVLTDTFQLGSSAISTTTAYTSAITPEKTQTYDRWNNVLSSTNADGYTTYYRYNFDNKETEEIKPTVTVYGEDGSSSQVNPTTYIKYDILGQQLTVTDPDGNTNGAKYNNAGHKIAEYQADGGITQHIYDLLGREVATIDPDGNKVTMTYDHDNNRTGVYHALSSDTYTYNQLGQRTSQTNGAGETTAYFYDALGDIVKTRLPMGNESYVKFDARGKKIQETWSGSPDSMSWSYDYFGHLMSHTDLSGYVTSYSYDFAGETSHMQSGRGANIDYSYYHNGKLKTITDNGLGTVTTYAYDAAGQKTRETLTKNGNLLSDTQVLYDSLGRMSRINDSHYRLQYGYDAQGNRRFVKSTYLESDGTYKTIQDWYKYDSMNRLVLTDGVLQNGQIVINQSQGSELAYDVKGNRTLATSYQNVNGSKVQVTDSYEYDANSRLIATKRNGNYTSQRMYNAAGRVSQYYKYKLDQPGVLSQRQVTTYNHNGWMLDVYGYDSSNTLTSNTDYAYSDSYDSKGDLMHYSLTAYGSGGYTNNYYYTYAKYDSYKQSKIAGSSNVLDPGQTVFSYDVDGNLTAVTDQQKSSNNRSYTLNETGQILVGHQNGKAQNYYYFDGKTIGTSGDLAADDFDYNYTAISDQYPAMSPSSYVVNSGDTLQSIALSVYGDSSAWYIIADANGMTSNANLQAGMTLTIPDKVTNVHNNASTFKPYNPTKIIGDTTPTLPVPPADKCAQAIISIVAIVVTVVLTALLGPEIGYPAGAAIGAMAGSVASQLVAMGLGLQKKFDWSSVAIAGVAGAISGGMTGGMAGTGATTASQVAAAMINNAVSQGLNIIAGKQDSFDWKSLAVSGIAAGISAKISGGKGAKSATQAEDPESSLRPFDFTKDLGKQFVNGVINESVHMAVYGKGKFSWANVAADAFGNALGDAAVHEIQVDRVMDYESQLDKFMNDPNRKKGFDLLASGDVKAYGIAGPAMSPEEARKRIDALAAAKKEMNIIDKRVNNTLDALNVIDSALKDPKKLAMLKAKGVHTTMLGKMREAYKADLIASDVYFNNKYDPNNPNTEVQALKAERSKEMLARLGVTRVRSYNDNGPTGSGYYGALYYDKNLKTYYMADRGTEFDKGISKAVADGRADFANAEGYLDPQYQKAVNIGRNVYSEFNGNVTFVGHSLGGGLATAQALAVNGRAITYNAASVDNRVASRLGINMKNSTVSVDAYYVKGELISWLQDSHGWDAANIALITPVKWAIGIVDSVREVFGANVHPNFAPAGISEAYGKRIGLEPIFMDANNPTFANDKKYTNFGFAGLDLSARTTLHFNSSVQASMEHWIISTRNLLRPSVAAAP